MQYHLQRVPVHGIRRLHSISPRRRPNDNATTCFDDVSDPLDTSLLAERQLAQICKSGYFDQVLRSTKYIRRYARKPFAVVLPDTAPWMTFARHVKDDPQSIDFARECMKAFNKRLAVLCPKDALGEIQHVKLGQQCLHWMLRSPHEVQNPCVWDLSAKRLLSGAPFERNS